MRIVWPYFLLGMILTGFPLSIFVLKAGNKPKEEVLSQKIESTSQPTLTPSPTPSPTPTPKPTKPPTPKPTPKPTMAPVSQFTSEQIYAFVEQYASQYNVDANILRYIAICESGFNQNSTNGPYAGLYQFSASSWAKYRNIMGESASPELRLNAEEAVKTAAYVLSINQAYIWPNCVP